MTRAHQRIADATRGCVPRSVRTDVDVTTVGVTIPSDVTWSERGGVTTLGGVTGDEQGGVTHSNTIVNGDAGQCPRAVSAAGGGVGCSGVVVGAGRDARRGAWNEGSCARGGEWL